LHRRTVKNFISKLCFSNSENLEFYEKIKEFKEKKTPQEKFETSKQILKKFLLRQSETLLNVSSTELLEIQNRLNSVQSKYNIQKLLNENEIFVKSQIKSTQENERVKALKLSTEEEMNTIFDTLFDSIQKTVKQNMNDSYLRFQKDPKFDKCIKILRAQQFKELQHIDLHLEVIEVEHTEDDEKSSGSDASLRVESSFHSSKSMKFRNSISSNNSTEYDEFNREEPLGVKAFHFLQRNSTHSLQVSPSVSPKISPRNIFKSVKEVVFKKSGRKSLNNESRNFSPTFEE
jgi:hypothetical protein